MQLHTQRMADTTTHVRSLAAPGDRDLPTGGGPDLQLCGVAKQRVWLLGGRPEPPAVAVRRGAASATGHLVEVAIGRRLERPLRLLRPEVARAQVRPTCEGGAEL